MPGTGGRLPPNAGVSEAADTCGTYPLASMRLSGKVILGTGGAVALA